MNDKILREEFTNVDNRAFIIRLATTDCHIFLAQSAHVSYKSGSGKAYETPRISNCGYWTLIKLTPNKRKIKVGKN